tara:strand:+ start:42 stop:500 length:459 start_codon:yes stop_codon:yes gene_type:complete
MKKIKQPSQFERGFSEDHRGSVEFYNNIDLSYFKRFYMVSNPKEGTVRAWHGHKYEGKLIKVTKGNFLVGAVKIDNWDSPGKDLPVELFEINTEAGLLYIPPGYANGAMNFAPDSCIMYFSTAHLDDSIEDDYRFDSKFWDPWTGRGGVIFE